jgi:HK97 family phage portal protein
MFRLNSALRTPEHRVAEDVSLVRWGLYKRRGDGTKKRVDNEVSAWWEMPSPGELGCYFRYSTVVNLDLCGNAFWWFRDPADITAGTVLLTRNQLVSLPTRRNPRWVFRIDCVDEEFEPREIVWLKRPDPGNPMGLGTGFGDALGPDLQQLEHMARFNNQFFRQGAHLGAVFGIEGASEEAWERFEESFRQEHSGIANAFKSHFVTGKVSGLQMGAKHKDLDFVEGYDQKRSSVRQAIGTPGEIIGDSKNSNRATSYEAGNFHQTYGMAPRLEHLCAVLNQIVLPKFGIRGYEFAYENPIREKDELQAAKFEAGMVRGAVKIDEFRRYLDLDPIPGGDRLIMPLNSVPIVSDDMDALRDALLARGGGANRNPVDQPATANRGKSILDQFLEGHLNGSVS